MFQKDYPPPSWWWELLLLFTASSFRPDLLAKPTTHATIMQFILLLAVASFFCHYRHVQPSSNHSFRPPLSETASSTCLIQCKRSGKESPSTGGGKAQLGCGFPFVPGVSQALFRPLLSEAISWIAQEALQLTAVRDPSSLVLNG